MRSGGQEAEGDVKQENSVAFCLLSQTPPPNTEKWREI